MAGYQVNFLPNKFKNTEWGKKVQNQQIALHLAKNGKRFAREAASDRN